jgi:hypothetical protein
VYVFANQKFVASEQSANLGQIGFNIHWALSVQRKKIHYAFQYKGCALERAGPRFGFKSQVEGFVRQYIL